MRNNPITVYAPASTTLLVLLAVALAAFPAIAQQTSNEATMVSSREILRSHTGRSLPRAAGELPLQFAPGMQFGSGGTKPWGVAVGDLNHDGKQDLVVVNQDQNTVAVMLGNGDGTFRAPSIYSLTPGVPYEVALADFNGDGKLDVAVVQGSIDGYTSDVVILLGNGDGTLGTPTSYGPGSSSISIVAADVNGDGKMDLVLGGNGSITLLYGNGDGRFQAPIYLDLVNNPTALWSVAVGDLNGDGRMDIVAAEFYPAAGIAVFLQNPDGSFAPGQSYSLGDGTAFGQGVAIADFNGDHKPDVVLASSNGMGPVFLGNGDGTFQQPIINFSGNSASFLAIADFNRDGNIDVAFANYSTTSGTGVFVEAGSGDGSLSFENAAFLNTSGGTTVVAVGDFNGDGWPDIVSADSLGNTVTVFLNVTGLNAGPLRFVPLSQPCRAVDTRPPTGYGPIQANTFDDFPISEEGGCAALPSAAAYSVNVTVVPSTKSLGYLTIWPTGESQPVVSTMNSVDGRIKADAAIVPAGASGYVSVYVTDTTNVIIDVNGYFVPVTPSALAFYPLTPCRVADTRNGNFPPGLGPPSLSAGVERQFPILDATGCNIPSSAAAYSLNFTVVPSGSLGYLTVWPTGQTRPTVSTLNDVLGNVIANAAIVVAGTGSEVSAYATDDTDLVIDINGYFAPPGSGALSLYGLQPCRVIDTRHVGTGQPFSGTLSPPVDVLNSGCGVSGNAQAYVFNATVVPVGSLGYLTLWPDGENQPVVSTLNAADGSLTNNMAIVPAGTAGKVDAFANGLTQLLLDISSYFAP